VLRANTGQQRGMVMRKPVGVAFAAALCVTGGAASSASRAIPQTFASEVVFLKQHATVVVLSSRTGDARLAIVPAWQGRVMTSTAEGASGQSFGWINHDLIRTSRLAPHINAFGGEDRFWIGPEGGQFG